MQKHGSLAVANYICMGHGQQGMCIMLPNNAAVMFALL